MNEAVPASVPAAVPRPPPGGGMSSFVNPPVESIIAEPLIGGKLERTIAIEREERQNREERARLEQAEMAVRERMEAIRVARARELEAQREAEVKLEEMINRAQTEAELLQRNQEQAAQNLAMMQEREIREREAQQAEQQIQNIMQKQEQLLEQQLNVAADREELEEGAVEVSRKRKIQKRKKEVKEAKEAKEAKVEQMQAIREDLVRERREEEAPPPQLLPEEEIPPPRYVSYNITPRMYSAGVKTDNQGKPVVTQLNLDSYLHSGDFLPIPRQYLPFPKFELKVVNMPEAKAIRADLVNNYAESEKRFQAAREIYDPSEYAEEFNAIKRRGGSMEEIRKLIDDNVTKKLKMMETQRAIVEKYNARAATAKKRVEEIHKAESARISNGKWW